MPATCSIDKLASDLGAVYRGGEYAAMCPVHLDSKPSLTFREDPATGTILFTCHAGCNNSDIITALAEKGLWASSSRNAGDRACYVYRSSAGVELFRVLRYPGKAFPLGRFLDGRWVSGLGDLEPVLYRFDELQRSDRSELVFVTEGEKDADTAAELGLVATTNHGGGDPDKWRESYSKALSGRKIVLLEDNDSKGRHRVTELKKRLSFHAASVAVVHFREMGKGADLTDWVEARRKEGLRLDQIKARLLKRIEASAAEERLGRYRSQSITDLVAKQSDLDQIEWILPGTLPVGEAFALIGDPGAGKSTAALALGKEIQQFRAARGIQRGKIVYLLLEGNTRNIIAATQELNINGEDVILLKNESDSTRFNMTDKRERDAVIQQILDYHEVYGVALVIFDSFSAASRDVSINDPRIGVVMQDLNAALDPRGITIGYINHCAKGSLDDTRAVNVSLGSGTFMGQVRTAFLMREDPKVPFGRRLCLVKSNHVPAPDPERDYYFLKHGGISRFASAEEVTAVSAAADEFSREEGITMKAKARNLVMESFLQPEVSEVLSKTFYDEAENRGISGKVMKETLKEMGVESRMGRDGQWYRYWPKRDLLYPHSVMEILPEPEEPPAQEPPKVLEVQLDDVERDCPAGTTAIFQALYISASETSDGEAVTVRVKRGWHFLDFILRGEAARIFRETRRQHLISGHRVTLQLTSDDALQAVVDAPEKSATCSHPAEAVAMWPRIRLAA